MKLKIYIIEYTEEEALKIDNVLQYVKTEIKKGIKPFITFDLFYNTSLNLTDFVDLYGEAFRSMVLDTYGCIANDRFILAFALEKEATRYSNKSTILRVY